MSDENEKPLSKKELRTKDRIALGKRIARLRKDAGYSTQGDLAARLPGVDRNLVSNWEIGHCAPDIFFVPTLCRALNCTFAQFFGESVFYSEHDIEMISKIATLTDEERQECLNYIDFIVHRRQPEPMAKK